MDKEIITKSKAQIKNKWFETKEDELDMSLNIIDELEQQVKKQKEVIDKAINDIDLVIELIKQQPTEDDSWILSRLNAFKIILKEVSDE